MIRPHDLHARSKPVPAGTHRIWNDRAKAYRSIKPIPIRMRAKLDLEARGDVRIVQTDVLIEMGGLEAELDFGGDHDGVGVASRTGTVTAPLVCPGECLIPPRAVGRIPTSAGALLGVDLRTCELEPLGRVIPVPPQTEGTASIEASFNILAAIGLSFTWVDSASPSDAELLLEGELRFLRGVIGRLILRTESPSRLSSQRYLNVSDVTLLPPGQVIRFPDQLIPLRGDAGESARIRHRFEESEQERRGL